VCEKENIVLTDTKSHKQVGGPIAIANNVSNNVNVLLAYSPNGQILAAAIDNSKIILWDVNSDKKMGQFDTKYEAGQMAFTRDGNTLVFASDGNLILFDVNTLTAKPIPAGGTTNPILSLAFSADSKYLAVGNQNSGITLWDAKTFKPIDKPKISSPGRVRSLTISPDGRVLAAGYADQNIILWDLETGQRLSRPLFKHTSLVYSLSFSSDGKFLASAGNEIILWAMDPGSWQAKACKLAGRNFTQAEWEQYFPGEEYRVTCPGFPAGK
jgi:WD40 repeat protein